MRLTEALVRDFQDRRVVGRNLNRIAKRVKLSLKWQFHIR